MFKFTALSVVILGLLIFDCSCEKFLCQFSSPESGVIQYCGSLIMSDSTIIDSDIAIYAANLDYKIFDKNNRPIGTPKHPNPNGSFRIGVTESSHQPCENVEHWECGPLHIYIEGKNIVAYYDSLSNSQLKQLKQNAAGEWELPVITLQNR